MIIAKSKIKHLVGYVTVRINGINKERFVNLCYHRNIDIWNLLYKDDYFEADIALWDFKKIKQPLKKTHVHIEIIEKKGCPFFFNKYKKRKFFALGVVLSIINIYLMSLFVWDISLDGGYSYTDIEITSFLKDIGVYEGIKKNKIDCEAIETKIRNNFYDITWVSAELTGTRLIIHIKENFDELDVEAVSNTPTDLIATSDAEIVTIITRTGTPKVKEGDKVKKGEVLVSGIIEIYDDNKEVKKTEYVTSDADIYAKVEYKYNNSFNTVYEEKKYTGNSKNRRYFQFVDYRISTLFLKKYEQYDIVKEEKQLHLFDSLYLPIYYGKESINEYVIEKKEYTNKEAIKIAEEDLEKFFIKMQEKGIQIIENNVKIDVGNGVCIASGNITIIKPIAISVPITVEGT